MQQGSKAIFHLEGEDSSQIPSSFQSPRIFYRLWFPGPVNTRKLDAPVVTCIPKMLLAHVRKPACVLPVHGACSSKCVSKSSLY